MLTRRLAAVLWTCWLATCAGTFPVSADELPIEAAAEIEGMQPVMVSLADRDPPSDEEWEALQEDTDRAGLFGSLGDLKSRTISFMDTQYFTPNCAEGTLASFGKVDNKHRFDRYGHIADVEFDVPRNSWKERYALNAAALVKLTGKARFAEVAGVELDTAVNDRRQIEVTFVGTMVPKDEAIRRLNADAQALEYLAELYDKRRKYTEKSVKLFAGPAPPEPKVVLANVVMLDGKSSKVLEGSLEGRAESVIHGIGGGLKLVKNGGEQIELLSPVVRCYRTYSIEFKTSNSGNLERTVRTCSDGRQHDVPTVFDLTPDL
jgi:hypothetical protein